MEVQVESKRPLRRLLTTDPAVLLCAALLAILASAKAPKMARRSGPSSAVSCISRSFRAFNGRPWLLYRARRSRRDRTRA